MDSKALADLVTETLEDRKGQHIVCLDVAELTPVADYMIIVTGTSTTHVKSMADEVGIRVKAAGEPVTGTEGRSQSEWVLVDLGSVVVHIMQASARSHYSLEDLWHFSAMGSAAAGRED
ncbi:MAG: ribosome silencing factor [Pseudohongiellaceae bacterium]